MRQPNPSVLALVFAIGACSRPDAKIEAKPEAPMAPIGGWYKATLSSASGGADVPFYLSVPADARSTKGMIVNGRHWLSVEPKVSGRTVVLEFPLYHTRIEASADAKGQLSGS